MVQFQAEDIDPSLCTHVNYAFAKLTDNRIAVYDQWLDVDLKMMERLNNLRKSNPHLKTLISIGGWNEGSNKYSDMVSSAVKRKVFVDSVLQFLAKYQFNGLDIDWEYPTMAASGGTDRTPGRSQDRQDFVSLLRELRQALQPNGYILSVAVAAGKPIIDRAYDVLTVSQYVDYFNVMTYDFHGAWERVTGHNAPLYPQTEQLTVAFAIKYWLNLGAPKSKLIMGIPLYGRTFTLAGTQNGIGAPAIGGGTAGPYTNQAGMLNYNEVSSSSFVVHLLSSN